MNDIALLRLDTSPYNLERRAAAGHPTTPVPLCPAALQPEGRKCRVSGWGHLKSKGSGVPDKLREVEVKVGMLLREILQSRRRHLPGPFPCSKPQLALCFYI